MIANTKSKINLGYLGEVKGNNMTDEDVVALLSKNIPDTNIELNLDNGFTKIKYKEEEYYVVRKDNTIKVAIRMPLVVDDADFTWSKRYSNRRNGSYKLHTSFGKNWNMRRLSQNENNYSWFNITYDPYNSEARIVYSFSIQTGDIMNYSKTVKDATNADIKKKMKEMVDEFKTWVANINLEFKEQ